MISWPGKTGSSGERLTGLGGTGTGVSAASLGEETPSTQHAAAATHASARLMCVRRVVAIDPPVVVSSRDGC